MDKRQLRQSAIADFMQSLEQLNELLGDETEAIWDDGAQGYESDKCHPVTTSSEPLHQPNSPRSDEAKAQEPQR